MAATGDLQLELSDSPYPPAVVTYPAGATWGPRTLEDFEFVWIVEGSAHYHLGSEKIPLPPMTVLLCRPSATDFFEWDHDGVTRHGFYHFRIQSIPSDWPPIERWPMVRTGVPGQVLLPLLSHVLMTIHHHGGAAHLKLAMGLALTAFVDGWCATVESPNESANRLPATAAAGEMRRLIEIVQKELDQDLAGALPVDALADELGISKQHLWRQCRSVLHVSPAELVRRLRFERAALLLLRSNYSVSRVSELCGFEHPSHFNERFKRFFRQTPSQFRTNGTANNLRELLLPGTPR